MTKLLDSFGDFGQSFLGIFLKQLIKSLINLENTMLKGKKINSIILFCNVDRQGGGDINIEVYAHIEDNSFKIDKVEIKEINKDNEQ